MLMERAELENLGISVDGRAVLKRKSFFCVTQFCGPKLIGSEWNESFAFC
jgi:hypothetical protein